jgi:putative oxidoreductase
MKIAARIARYLLGIIFLIFGLNGFLHFIPMGPPPSGPAVQFYTALAESHYVVFLFGLQVIVAILLLINRYVPLALTLIAPVIVNILLFHSLMAPAGLPLALFVTVLWILVAWSVSSAFVGILQARSQD